MNELHQLRAKLESIEKESNLTKATMEQASKELTRLAIKRSECMKVIGSLTLASEKGPYATQPL